MAVEHKGLPLHIDAVRSLSQEHQRLAMLSIGRRFSDREAARLLETSIQQVKTLRKELGIEKGYRGKIVSVAGEDPANVPAPEPEEIFVDLHYKLEGMQGEPADDTPGPPDASQQADGNLATSHQEQFRYVISGSDDRETVAARMEKLAELIETLDSDVVEFDVSIRT